MKALVKTGMGAQGTKLTNWDESSILKDDEILIRIEWVGICGTDISILKETVPHMIPVVLGHELAGIVIEVGMNVTDFCIGDKITAETSIATCGVCRNCQDGDYNVCKQRLGMGRTSHGAFRNQMRLNHKLAHKLPQTVTIKEAALCEPAAVAYHAVIKRGKVQLSENVFIFGPGPIGILVAQIAIFAGANVTVVGLSEDSEKLKICGDFGCHTIKLDSDTELVAVNEVDVVFECSGSANAAHDGLEMLRPRGRYVQVGLFKKNPALPMNTVAAKELCILGCYSTVSSDFDSVLELIEQQKLNLKCLISGTYPLDDWENAFAQAEQNSSIKVLIKL